MYVNKNFTLYGILRFSGGHIIWLAIWAMLMTCIYEFTAFSWSIPWLPLSVIGTAVAFYVGFKNNSAYDRLWEARKIWGAIVNSSRSWGTSVRAFVSDTFIQSDDQTILECRKRLIHRHIAWLYTLRNQLLIPTNWEHVNAGKLVRMAAKHRMKRWGIGLHEDGGFTEEELKKYLPKDEYEKLIDYQNTATQIIDKQSQDLLILRKKNLIDDFRQMDLQKILNDFYDHQGKAERIKKFPLPRQYGSMSFVFVAIFISSCHSAW